MDTRELVVDSFGRIRDATHRAGAGLTPEQLAFRPGDEANSIAWLIWHLTRIQDDHIAGVAGTEQRWTAQGWYDQFAFPFPASATGYGHSRDEVAAVRVDSVDALLAYHDAVHDHTVAFVRTLAPADYDRVVDTSWDPPVTLGVRIVSVVADDLQHVGQAAYVRGLIAKRPPT